jgi:hypothetical protein
LVRPPYLSFQKVTKIIFEDSFIIATIMPFVKISHIGMDLMRLAHARPEIPKIIRCEKEEFRGNQTQFFDKSVHGLKNDGSRSERSGNRRKDFITLYK